MEILSKISPEGLAILTVIIAILLSEGLNLEQTNVVGNFLSGIGGNMTTIATQEAYLQSIQSLQEQNKCLNQQIDVLKNQIKMLQNKGGR